MSRSGYCDDADDQWQLIMWRGAVASSIRGKRGQAFLAEMRDALDSMPEKRLAASELEADGQVCAIGSVGRARGIDMGKLDPEDYSTVAGTFNIAEPLAREIVFMNDEYWYWSTNDEGRIRYDDDGKGIKLSPEERFTKMRAWIERNLKSASPQRTGQ